jgi:hypothetical protein
MKPSMAIATISSRTRIKMLCLPLMELRLGTASSANNGKPAAESIRHPPRPKKMEATKRWPL